MCYTASRFSCSLFFPAPPTCKSCCLDVIELTANAGAEFDVPFDRFPVTASLVLPPIWPLTSSTSVRERERE